jgi:hypothetical protein
MHRHVALLLAAVVALANVVCGCAAPSPADAAPAPITVVDGHACCPAGTAEEPAPASRCRHCGHELRFADGRTSATDLPGSTVSAPAVGSGLPHRAPATPSALVRAPGALARPAPAAIPLVLRL